MGLEFRVYDNRISPTSHLTNTFSMALQIFFKSFVKFFMSSTGYGISVGVGDGNGCF